MIIFFSLYLICDRKNLYTLSYVHMPASNALLDHVCSLQSFPRTGVKLFVGLGVPPASTRSERRGLQNASQCSESNRKVDFCIH